MQLDKIKTEALLVSDGTSDESEADEKVYGVEKKKKAPSIRSRLDFFEKTFVRKKKGTCQVWKTSVESNSELSADLYLHAVNDSKIVFRLTNHYAALPKTTMEFTVLDPSGIRIKKTLETSQAHRRFRKSMGHNDQSDVKRTQIGLTRRYYKR